MNARRTDDLPFVEFTTFDGIYLTKKIMEGIMSERGITDPADVTGRMFAESFQKGGIKRSLPQLLSEKRLALGFSDEAYAALQAVSGSDDDPLIDVKSLSKNMLDNHNVTTDLKKHPLEQSLLVHILARYKKHNGKILVKAKLPSLKDRAMEAGDLYRRVESVIPRKSWTPDFRRCLEALLYGRQQDWEICGSGHMKSKEEEIAAIRESERFLSPDRMLSADYAKIIREKLPGRLERAARKSAELGRHVDAWEQRMAEVNDFLERRELSSDSSDSSDEAESPSISKNEPGSRVVSRTRAAGSDDNLESGDPGKGKGESKSKGKGKTVLGQCREHPAAAGGSRGKSAGHRVKEVSLCKGRPCTGSSSDQPPSKKPKNKDKGKGKATVLTIQQEQTEAIMSRCTTVHAEQLFVGNSKADSNDGGPLRLNTAPKLAVVDLTREPHLLENTESSNRALKGALQSIVDALHPQGTMALAWPRLWHSAGLPVAGALAEIKNAVVEDSPLLITHDSVPGDDIQPEGENQPHSQAELVLIVHRFCPLDKPFTCNRGVGPSDVFDRSTGEYPNAGQILPAGAMPAGAQNAGSTRFFTVTAAQFLIGRFTNTSDTVLGIGLEATSVAEQAIGKGRCVEFFVADQDKRDVLRRSLADAFYAAHSRGMFQEESQLGEDSRIGPENSPHGLPSPSAPPRVTRLLKGLEMRTWGDLAGCFEAARTVAKESNFFLKGEKKKAKAELWPRKQKSEGAKALDFDDIPVWGSFIVYSSPEEAERALEADEVDAQYVRLVLAADNEQLRLMLEVGVEWCGNDAALYVQVDPACPVYWVRWSDQESEADLDLVSDIFRRGDWSTVNDSARLNDDGEGGVKVRYARNKPSETSSPDSQHALLVNASGGRIVGSASFRRRMSPHGP